MEKVTANTLIPPLSPIILPVMRGGGIGGAGGASGGGGTNICANKNS